MTPPTDSAGVPFDAAIHQAYADGTPRTTKEGRYFIKGRRKPRPGAAPKKAKRPAPVAKAAPTPEAPPPAPAPDTLAPELAAIPKASAADILGRPWPEPTIDDDAAAPEAPEESAAAPEEPTAAGSFIAPDAPPPPAAQDGAGLAFALVAIGETSARVGIDPTEWELKPEERAALAASVQKVLDKHGINPELSPEAELVLNIGAVTARRAPLPKTRAAIQRAFAWVGGFFRRPPRPAPAPAAAPANPPPAPANPHQEAEQTAPPA